MRKLRWDTAKPSTPKHPYRDSAIAYAFMAALVIAITALTGGSLVEGVIAGVAVFAAATAYNWWRVRERLRRQERGER